MNLRAVLPPVVRPRATHHVGWVAAEGLLFDEAPLGEAELRRRVLAHWTPGAVVLRVSEGLVLLPPRAIMVRCEAIGALPLTRLGAVLASAPLTLHELEALDPPAGSLVLVKHGVAIAVALDAQALVDPAEWLDLGPLEPTRPDAVASAPASPPTLAPVVPTRARLLGAGEQAPSELAEVVAALERAREAPEAADAGPGVAQRLGASLGRLWSRLLRRDKVAAVDADRPPRRPGRLARWGQALRGRVVRWLGLAGLGALIGRRQARYIGRMMEMFEKGSLDEALRHAIPLSAHRPPSALQMDPLRLPRPRRDLRVSSAGQGPTMGVALQDALYDQLRQMYRVAFNRLKFQERIPEAAFVLAELLDEPERAVELCEETGLLTLAAEIAEARELPPGLVVRQWFLAGDRARAVRLARRGGAFADAVVRLERTDPAAADALRLLWADAMAESGDFPTAVDVVWPVEAARSLARAWMDRAVAVGGATAARMLARKAALVPEAFADVCGQALALLDDERPEAEPARRAFVEALEAGPATRETATLARPALRAWVRDRAAHGRVPQRRELERLLALADDGALRADVRRLGLGPAGATAPERPAVVRLEALGGGALEPRDAALTADGRLLVALGEAGTRLVTLDGRAVAHFEAPADRLVMADGGDRALAVASRGGLTRVTRVDLAGRQVRPWGELALTTWAPTYDGSLWFVANGDAVEALDALADAPASLWRVGDLGGTVAYLARSERRLSFLVEDPAALDRPGDDSPWALWTYGLPDPRLKTRAPVRFDVGAEVGLALGLAPEGVAVGLRTADEASELVLRPHGAHMPPTPSALPPREGAIHLRAAFSQRWMAVPRMSVAPLSADVHVYDRMDGALAVRVELIGCAPVAVRLQDRLMTLVDDRGRVAVVDLDLGELWRHVRL